MGGTGGLLNIQLNMAVAGFLPQQITVMSAGASSSSARV